MRGPEPGRTRISFHADRAVPLRCPGTRPSRSPPCPPHRTVAVRLATRASTSPRPARPTSPFSLVTHSPRAASTACAVWVAARAIAPATCVTNLVDREFGDEQVRRDARQVEHQGLDAEAAPLRFRQLVCDDVQIAVVDVHTPPVDRQPGAAVEDAAAPRADLGDLALPAERPEVVRVEGAPVVDRQVPVAVRAFGALGAGAAQGDRPDGGEGGEAAAGRTAAPSGLSPRPA